MTPTVELRQRSKSKQTIVLPRWSVACPDGNFWEQDLSFYDAEVEQVAADSECDCEGQHRIIPHVG